MRSLRRHDVAAVLGVLCVALGYTFDIIWRRAQQGPSLIAFDVYLYSVPNFIYASEAIARGYGLLWNDLQNCGQPFFGFISSALLYPPNALLLIAPDINSMIFGHTIFNLTLTGVGMYFFCREAGLGRLAAVFGAVALELGATSLGLANWNFALHAAWVWLPWSLFFTERILRSSRTDAIAGPGLGIGLGFVLTLQLFAGFPQIGVFTYELIGLRVLWELATRRDWPWFRASLVVALGLVIPVLLGAIQLLPALDVIRDSVRSLELTAFDVNPLAFSWGSWQHHIGRRSLGTGTLFCVVGLALVGPALTSPRVRRVAWFGVLAGGLFIGFSLEGPIQDMYRSLPVLGNLFRGPNRFLWVTSFAFSLIIACGADAIGHGRDSSKATLAAALVASLAGITVFRLVADDTLLSTEWWLLAGTLVVIAIVYWQSGGVVLWGRGRVVARFVLLALLLANLYVVPRPPAMSLLESGSAIYTNQKGFDFLESRMTAQDRFYPIGRHSDPALMAKSGSVFGLPSVSDYEPQSSLRYADLFVYMISGRPMLTLSDYYYTLRVWPESRRLMNIMALRYVFVDAAGANSAVPAALEAMRPGLIRIWSDESLHIYMNRYALPRAFYVPKVRVVPDSAALLRRLASRENKPKYAALIEAPLEDDFVGLAGGRGKVEISSSRGEELVLKVDATQEGFLFLADQYASGWEATVNDVAVPIHRANYAFRLVRVPEGESTVVFRYRPLSLVIGTGVSLLTLLAILAYAGRSWMAMRRNRKAEGDQLGGIESS